MFGPELDNHQRIDLLGHLEEFTGVLQDKPGERCLRSIALRQEQLAQCVNIPIEYPKVQGHSPTRAEGDASRRDCAFKQ